jgi:hypothetical protein
VFVDPAHASAGKDWLCTAATPPHAVEGREWTVPGWWTGATTWTAQQVDAAGLGATRAIEQVRAWQFSRVLQVEMEQECLSFRARQGRTPARRESESQVVYHLARRAVTFVPDVLAVNSYARGFCCARAAGTASSEVPGSPGGTRGEYVCRATDPIHQPCSRATRAGLSRAWPTGTPEPDQPACRGPGCAAPRDGVTVTVLTTPPTR